MGLGSGKGERDLGVAEGGFGSYVKPYKPWFIGREAFMAREKTRKGVVVRFTFTEQEVRDFAPVRQRLVRTHRKTGRKSLFLSSHAGRILGMEVPEAQMLLRELTEHATQREFVYSHKWQVGDLVVWDNRTTMHRARRFDDEKYPRDLRRTTLTDGVPTVEQALSSAA